jgi:hypothetical protein
MAKTLRTSGDYTIKAGSGSAGSNQILLDSQTVRVTGDLMIDGSQTVINTETLSVEDAILVLNRNESSNALTGSDSGIIINRGEVGVNATFYWDESLNVFKVATTSNTGTGGVGTTITDLALAKLRVAYPVGSEDAATKQYVDDQVVSASGMTDFNVVGDDSTGINITDGEYLKITGGNNIGVVVAEPDTVTINLNQALSEVNSISASTSNGSLTLISNGTGDIVVNDTLTFSGNASTPSAASITKLYSKTVGGGGTGVFFINSAVSSGTEDELISKKKATALAIALG